LKFVMANPAKLSWNWLLALTFIVVALTYLLITQFGFTKSANNQADSAQLPSTQIQTKISDLKTYLSVDTNLNPIIYSKAYALIDSSTGQLIVSKDENEPLPIASTTKMVTALVAEKSLPLDRVVTISDTPLSVIGSKIGLVPGEKITIKNLLTGLLVSSGNDAAYTLAEVYSGRVGEIKPFVDAMNEFAKAHHLNSTVYDDPAGLSDEKGRSTALELAHIGRLVLQDDLAKQIVATPKTTISSVDGTINHDLVNTNRLIQSDSPYYLINAVGIKTGYTNDAGHSMVGAYKIRDRILVGVVLNTAESTNTASAQEMAKLFSWADKHVTVKYYN
jgi:D-alanyl-D-alanine carboxypeptidase (penicillin-binding protein 5/6)